MTFRDQFDQIEHNFLTNENYQQRGSAFEILINDLFSAKQMLICPTYRTRGDVIEQIDGAIKLSGRIFLLEIKWCQKQNIAESELYAFLGKIRTKIPGTLGLFISYERLSKNFVNAIRYGQQQICLIIHGRENIEAIIDEKIDLKDYLTHLYEFASAQGIIELDVSEYLDYLKSKPNTKAKTKTLWDELISDINSKKISASDFGMKYSHQDLQNYSEDAIRVFPYIVYQSYTKYEILLNFCSKDKSHFKNLFFKTINECDINNFLKPTSQMQFSISETQYYSNNFISMIEKLNLPFNGKEDGLKEYVDKLILLLNEQKGLYENENIISRYVELVRPILSRNQLMELAQSYFDIYIDTSRKERYGDRVFENKKVAKEIIEKVKADSEAKNQIFIPFIQKKLTEWHNMLMRFKDQKPQDSVWHVMQQYGEGLSNIHFKESDVDSIYKQLFIPKRE